MTFRNYRHTLIGTFIFIILLSSCSQQTGLDQILFKETKNKIYKDLNEEKFSQILKTTLDKEAGNLKKGKFITDFYRNNGYQASLLKKFFPKEKLNLLAERLNNASEHGIKPAYFNAEAYQKTLGLVDSKDGIKTLDDAYAQLAKLEIATADALLSYSSALQFGIINPNKTLQRYYIETKQADTSFMENILKAANLDSLLDSIQPKSDTYLALQKALKSDITAEGESKDETMKTIMVNLERARWKQDIDRKNMIYVNIPAFRLDVIKDGKATKNMKVVVGTGRNNSGKATFSDGNAKIKDTPNSHETPVLASRIHSVQVNPVWNIPESIAGKEILKHVQNDRFYLANAGIDVLQNGKVLDDPENIDWSAYSPGNLPYRFRQRPGDENSLGKIKFLFKNNSSVYLHDTPAQAAFDRDVRASSHGCVRVAEPLDLAEALFGSGDKFNTIKKDMESSDQEEAKDIALSPKTQVVLDYKTIEVKDNKLQFYPDVYGQDIVLYSYM